MWICPPLAFARFGRSETPLENFHWAYNDYAARGTAETVIEPTWTFEIDPDGNISAYLPEEIRFRDMVEVEVKHDLTGEYTGEVTQTPVWRPLCPFFEVHGRWSDGEEGPLSYQTLAEAGIKLGSVVWEVETANHKAYVYTQSRGDMVSAKVRVRGNDHTKHELEGRSPRHKYPLVPPGTVVPFGKVQVIRPNPEYPELRLRLTPPEGLIYAPTNTADRDLAMLLPGGQGQEKFLEQIHCILNPDSPWTTWAPTDGDYRKTPGPIYASEPDNTSLGFFDDSNDGHIKVTIKGEAVAGGELSAYARYTCGPPDFQPDRRPFTTVADGLSDAVRRESVLEPSYVGGDAWPQTELEISDLMQRVRETMEASNLDHQNLRAYYGNQAILGDGRQLEAQYPFEPQQPRPGHPLPLLTLGRDNHARFLAYEVFKQHFGLRPNLFERWIRDPTAPLEQFDNKMPALMRGSDSYAMSINQRQYEFLKHWLAYIEREVQADK